MMPALASISSPYILTLLKYVVRHCPYILFLFNNFGEQE